MRRNIESSVAAGALLFGLLLAGQAAAHIALTYPAPRSTVNSNQVAPCGAYPKKVPTKFAPGQKVIVKWNLGAAHNGTLRIAFSPSSDQGFTTPANILASGVTEVAGNAQLEVTLPMTPCAACTLQVAQLAGAESYYSCADIAIEASKVDAGISVPDAGAAVVDAGTSVPDAGSAVADAGAVPEDPAVQPLEPKDAGSGKAPLADAGVGTQNTSPDEAVGCSAAAGLPSFSLVLLGLALWWIRRRTRGALSR